jgi:guanylate kinase
MAEPTPDPSARGRLVVLMGPSCAGKSPLKAALAQHRPALAGRLRPVVLYNDRAPRPGEEDGVDYHFRRTEEIEALREKDDYVVLRARADLQALDLAELGAQLREGDVLYEGNPMVGRTLLTHEALAGVPRLGIFLSPLSRAEILAFREAGCGPRLPAILTEMMRRKLRRRARGQKGALSPADLEDIETRAASAWGELTAAPHCDHVIPNHDGEDSEDWTAFPLPVGDAFRALQTFAALLEDRPAPLAERWEADLLPAAD